MSTRVKGAVLLARRAFVVDEHGEPAWQKVLEALSADARGQFERSILTSSWYPFELNEELDRAIVRIVGGGDPDIFKVIGARSARQNLGGPHRDFLVPGDPQQSLAKTEMIYSFYYDQGHRTYEATGPCSGVMTTHEAETFSHTDCLTVIGWYEEALKMCGAREVSMEEPTCRARGGEFCRYEIRFEMG
jgi:hypothetical protein